MHGQLVPINTHAYLMYVDFLCAGLTGPNTSQRPFRARESPSTHPRTTTAGLRTPTLLFRYHRSCPHAQGSHGVPIRFPCPRTAGRGATSQEGHRVPGRVHVPTCTKLGSETEIKCPQSLLPPWTLDLHKSIKKTGYIESNAIFSSIGRQKQKKTSEGPGASLQN